MLVIAMPQATVREYNIKKSFNFVLPIEKIANESSRIIDEYASTISVDEDEDVIAKEALANVIEDYMKYPTVRFIHDGGPIGKTIDA